MKKKADKKDMTNSTPAGSISPELAEELELLQKLKPFIGQCLTLNHDLNNPLAGIIGYGEFLLTDADNLNEDQVEYIKRMLSCADRMRKLIEKLCIDKGELNKVVDVKQLTDQYKTNSH